MTFTLRPYQQRCVDAVVRHITTRLDSCVVDAAPAAGKSYIIAGIAKYINQKSGKKILALAPSSTLIKQNREKYLLTGEPCSVFSASAGYKSTRHPVVFATAGTVKNSLSRFTSGEYAAVVIDEAHGITPTIRGIIDALRQSNPNLRVIALSGTCYRMDMGYIFRVDENDKPVPDTQTRDPYFSKLVCRVPAQEMLEGGYITPMEIGAPLAEGYDTSGLTLGSNGEYTASSLEQAFVGYGRKTAAIVADVVAQAQSRKGGVMLFAATRQHAAEIMASLPPHNSVMVVGDKANEEDIKAYKEGRKRYIVSVGMLTTGFDAPHTEIIALLRKTSSAALLQQMMGRAWRLHDEKKTGLLLDYAGNLEEHFPDGDIYSPEIKAPQLGTSSGILKCCCPDCGAENQFSARKNDEGYEYDAEGYFIDLDGNRIMTEHGPIPGHYGRRCLGVVQKGRGVYEQCDYRYTFKECIHCHEPNDIAARYCCSCRGELIDPNEKLQIEFRALKRSPYNRQCDEVLEYDFNESLTQSGRECYRVNFKTPYRSFTIWIMKEPRGEREYYALQRWKELRGQKPETVEYQKEKSGFFTVFGYNKEADKEPV